MSYLTELPNIGKVLSEKLQSIGITSREELEKIGSVEAVLRIGEKDLSTCYSMLYALEGAIRGIRWYGIPKEERKMLMREFNESAR